jgi:hypothetical protein
MGFSFMQDLELLKIVRKQLNIANWQLIMAMLRANIIIALPWRRELVLTKPWREQPNMTSWPPTRAMHRDNAAMTLVWKKESWSTKNCRKPLDITNWQPTKEMMVLVRDSANWQSAQGPGRETIVLWSDHHWVIIFAHCMSTFPGWISF